MTDVAIDGQEQAVDKKGKKGLVIGLALAFVGGAASFAVTYGLVPLGGGADTHSSSLAQDYAFVSLEPMTVPLGGSEQRRFLRFRAELEVDIAKREQVERLLPRVVDVLNTYLRSLDLADIEDPSSLLALRAQMRRRVDLVVGGDAVHDLLVMEFVVN